MKQGKINWCLKQCIMVLIILGLTGCIHSNKLVEEDIVIRESSQNIKADVTIDKLIQGHTLRVHFINVGQGDSVLIEGANGEVMLIDTGTTESYELLQLYLKEQGIGSIDYVVGSHPHKDHIGSMASIIKDYHVKELWLSNVPTDSLINEGLLEAAETMNVPIIYPKKQDTFQILGCTFEIIGPEHVAYEETNNASLIIKMTYGEVSFLFTGDAEEEAEDDMIAFGGIVKVDVLKVGHHGSSSSTTADFVAIADPQIAVVSCGRDNEYGYPHHQVLSRLETISGSELYRTDLDGSVVVSTEGSHLSVTTQTDNQSIIKANKGIRIQSIDPKDEVVVLINTSSVAIDISGWTIVSERGIQTKMIPQGIVLESKALYTIGNPKKSVDLTWEDEDGSGVWNNSKEDNGLLYDAYGNLISVYLDDK